MVHALFTRTKGPDAKETLKGIDKPNVNPRSNQYKTNPTRREGPSGIVTPGVNRPSPGKPAPKMATPKMAPTAASDSPPPALAKRPPVGRTTAVKMSEAPQPRPSMKGTSSLVTKGPGYVRPKTTRDQYDR